MILHIAQMEYAYDAWEHIFDVAFFAMLSLFSVIISMIFASKLIRIAVNIRQTLPRIKITNVSTDMIQKMTPKQMNLLNVITKQTVLNFCQTFIGISNIFFLEIDFADLDQDVVQSILETTYNICLLLWFGTLCLSFVFLSKYYSMFCHYIHQCCLLCWVKYAIFRTCNQSYQPTQVPLMTVNDLESND